MNAETKNNIADFVKTILHNCVGNDENLIKEIALCFNDNEAISKNQRKKVYTDVKDGFFKEAIEFTVDSLLRHGEDHWKLKTVLALDDKDFPGDECMVRLLVYVLDRDEIPDTVSLLIRSWNELENAREKILQSCKLNFPDEEISSSMWPLHLIHKCSTKFDQILVDRFVEDIKTVIVGKEESTVKKQIKHEFSENDEVKNQDSEVSSSAVPIKEEIPSKKAKSDENEKPSEPEPVQGARQDETKSQEVVDDIKRPNVNTKEHVPIKPDSNLEKKKKVSSSGDKMQNENEKTDIAENSKNKEITGANHKKEDGDGRNLIHEFKSAEDLKKLHSESSEDVEFRVILAAGSSIPSYCRLCICTESFCDWKPLEMTVHDSGKYYFCVLPIDESRKVIRYKYLFQSSDSYQWETFLHCGSVKANRIIYDSKPGSILQDVVSFVNDSRTRSWKDLNNQTMIGHLPISQQFVLRSEMGDNKNVFSFGKEVFAWLHNFKNGWRITDSYYNQPWPSSHVIEASLLGWLQSNFKRCEDGNKFDVIRRIVSTLTLVLALHDEKHVVDDSELLRLIFLSLSTHKLNEEDQKLLYEEIMAQCEEYEQNSIPSILDSILDLFKRVPDHPMAQWLLALPLLWLVADKGVIQKTSVKEKVNQGGLLFQRSNLPSGNGLKWSEIKRVCARDRIQESFLRMSPAIHEIFKVHPWIVGSFQYVLKEQILIHIIKEREKNKIGNDFLIDSVFSQLLHGSLASVKHSSQIALKDVAEISEYLICSLQRVTEEAKSTNLSPSEVKDMLEIPSNILSSFSVLLMDIAKNTFSYKTNTEDGKNVLWCLNMVSNTAVLAKSLSRNETEEGTTLCEEYLKKIVDSVKTRIHKCLVDEDQIQFWNSLMIIQWHSPEFTEKWKRLIRDEIVQKIENNWQHKNEEFLDYYAVTLEKTELESSVESCFSEKAFKCTEDLLMKHGGTSTKKGGSSWKSTLRGYASYFKTPRFIQIFDKLFIRELQKTTAQNQHASFDMQAFQFLFSWTFAAQFYRLFYVEETLSKFSSKTKKKIEEVADAFRCTVASLRSGDVVLKQLRLILNSRAKFLEMYESLKFMDGSSVDTSTNYLSHILDHLEKKLESFETAKSHVKGFLRACAKLEEGHEVVVKTAELKDKLKTNFEEKKLSEISPDLPNKPAGMKQTTFFNLTENVLEQFKIVSFIKESKVFLEMWNLNAVAAKNMAADAGFDLGDNGLWHVRWKEALDDIWTTTRKELITLAQEVDSGELRLDEASEWFERCSGERKEINIEIKMLYEYYELATMKEEKIEEIVTPIEEEIQDAAGSDMSDEEKDSDEDSLSSKSESESESDKDSSKEDEPPPVAARANQRDSDDTQSEGSFSDDAQDFQPLVNFDLRMRQLCNYFQLEKSQDTIDLLLNIREKFKLSGDFSSLETQKEMTQDKGNKSIEELPDYQDIPAVCNIVRKNVDTLRLFMNEEQLIFWLKDKMDDISEVKVMCDLAMISAGETPFEVDKVSCLLSAVMGFAPLIFELQEKDGLKELLQKCEHVWKNNEEDVNLEEKWKDTGRHLVWFKGIENFHGSVEKQSLTLAQEINEHGIYMIRRRRDDIVPTAKSCIELSLPAKSREATNQKLQLNELCDLQSKLMLIAGEAETGQKDVIQFVEVLTAVQTLAETFVKLVTAGCMLFNDWSTIITCDRISSSDATDNLLIQVKFSDNAQPLGGPGSLADLNALCVILNQALERWNSYVDVKRMEHYYLNEYNIQQIIYLCHQLAVCENRISIPDQVYSLLSSVARNSGLQQIQESLNEATKIRDEEIQQAEEENLGIEEVMEDEAQGIEEGEEVNMVELKNRAVRTLVGQDDIQEDIAKAAVQAEGLDIEDCLNWALLNQFSEEMIKELSEKFDEEAGFSHGEREVQVITSVLHNRSQNTLKDVIDRLQDKIRGDTVQQSFKDSVNTICAGYLDETMVITLRDYLSIEHLGRFLKILHEKVKGWHVHRALMPPLHSAKPNLIICPEQEILSTVLSLYMHNPDQPLPTTSEVLLCSEKTTADEVERFMMKAMCKCENDDKLIFALAFADKLSFNVSTATERIFNVLSQEMKTDGNYQLVILLSKQQHYLTTCFDKYMVEGKWIKSTSDISSYLEKHLTVNDVDLMNSAACVDERRCMVKIISSTRSGVGKSLHVKRMSQKLDAKLTPLLVRWQHASIRLLEKTLEPNSVISRLYKVTPDVRNQDIMLIHLDITPAVQQGIETFAFNLFVLGSIQDSHGKIWKRHPHHMYAVEMTDCGFQGKGQFSHRHILNLLPCVKCFAPREVLQMYTNKNEGDWLGMDEKEFKSDTFQRPFQYLLRYEKNEDLDSYVYTQAIGNPKDCTEILLKHCCMENPSWAQLRHFASFLNVQLQNCENSIYCDRSIVGDELRGLKSFAVRFMIRMSQDFATPSLRISDESKSDHAPHTAGESGNEEFEVYQFRRKWEESSHPYIFFNEDRTTMTFINVNVSNDGDLLDKNGEVTEPAIVSKELIQGLKLQRVSLDLNFDTFTRDQKLGILCQVMGIQNTFDPDPTYELTTDNVLKILAIYMRFRCQIPVIIMGETGCGKTRMVEFMSRLKAGPGRTVRNMITLKIHGGITVSNIHESVKKAQEIARNNSQQHRLSTILFYDEANTTEAIYAIKEVMCDLTIDGKSFEDAELQLVAACNPYKQLSKEAIRKLEDSGLGYRIRTSETTHLFGNIPMRTLVYRVVALPPSMQPFVWDFGQLSEEAEGIYIQQMAKKMAINLNLPQDTVRLAKTIFSEAQKYMRSRHDECRYVSLRDVERCIVTYTWFHEHRELLYPLVEKEIDHRYGRMNRDPPELSDGMRTLLQTIGVCYHASLDDRLKFRNQMVPVFRLEGLHLSEADIREELTAAQTVFLKNMKMDDNIACNEALQENVFMMTVCADMRIPLFLIGKPGSSKSLAKTILADNMQGGTSRSRLYKKLKQVHILSYQCSALTDASGIESVFKQCAQLQNKQDLKSYTAVVVLDEIGLAEDSPNMPLKVLHPLLECGSTESGSLTDYDPSKKVGFVGISNWALDPAKMNRGIFVTRNKPSKDDLKKTAKGIFENQKSKINENLDLLETLTETYLQIYEAQKVEYFGLRDYYSLIKMIHTLCKSSNDAVPFADVANAILRNFSGGRTPHFETFRNNLQNLYHDAMVTTVPVKTMIQENLLERESRFLLLLTNQFSAVGLLHLCVDDFEERVQVVFGSSFPGDHNYTDICRNINRIKVCMETGRTVVLLNMTEIHESLYDALNQHYVTFGGQRYVDLGLGGHRVKCRIADDFRLIVVEQKEVVYSEYPIPLINRLEKHHLESKSLLSIKQRKISESLSEWAHRFSAVQGREFGSKDAFLGFHDDTVSSVTLTADADGEHCKLILLQSCAMDAVFRLPESGLGGQVETVQDTYLHHQIHDSLLLLLRDVIDNVEHRIPLLEVTSYSNILSEKDREEIENELQLMKNSVMLLSLEQFQTEQEYSNKLDEFFKRCKKEDVRRNSAILLIQCSQAQSHGQLVACAKYCLTNKVKEFRDAEAEELQKGKVIIAFLLSTERESRSKSEKGSLVLQHTKDNRIVYVDELRPTNKGIAPASHFYQMTLCQVLEMGKAELEQDPHGSNSLVNIMSLLEDCVCEAVGKVKSRLSKSERYIERVKILSDLCSQDNVVGVNFRKILLDRLIDIYKEREEQNNPMISGSDWIVNEACNRESLQEGGTFRKTLWLCLKRHVSRLLAYVLSIFDRNDNLDLLIAEEAVPWKIDMWLKMLHVIPLTWSAVGSAEEFIIVSPRHHKSTLPCHIPFSFVLIDYFDTQWNVFAKQQSHDINDKFFSLFRAQPMHKIVAAALDVSKIANMMKVFTSDLVKALYFPSTKKTDDEYAVVEKVIFERSLKKYNTLRREPSFTKGDEIALIFLCFKEVENCLQILSRIFKASPDIIIHADEWRQQQRDCNEFLTHVFAFKSVLETMKENAAHINEPVGCLNWINQATTAKRIFNDLVDMIQSDEERKELVHAWMPLSLLDLLLMQLLPSVSEKDVFDNYLSVISPHAKLLWRGSVRADMRSEQFLRIVSNVLRRCYDDIILKFLVSWTDIVCKICKKKVQEPTFIPCGHFTCKTCLERLLATPTGRRCPTCADVIPDDYVLRPASLDAAQVKQVENFKSNCTSFFLEYLKQFCFHVSSYGAPVQMDVQVKLLLEELVTGAPNKERKELENSALDLDINARSCILRILLNHNAELVKEELNEWLLRLSREHLRGLTTVVLKCFEQKLLLDSSSLVLDERARVDRWEKILGSAWRKILLNGETMDKVALLQTVAEMRCGLMQFADHLNDKFNGKELHYDLRGQVDSFISFALKISTDDVSGYTLQEYVVKVACQKFGTEWFYKLADHVDLLDNLIPPALIQATEDSKVDCWSLLGAEYTKAKSTLYKTSLENIENVMSQMFQQDTPVNRLARMLAVISWSQKQDAKMKQLMKECLKKSPDSGTYFFRFLLQMDESFIPDLEAAQYTTEQRAHTFLQLITMVFATVTSQSYMMQSFHLLATAPNVVSNMFLPAMPEDLYFATPADYRMQGNTNLYTCPNGHLYIVGECRQPMETAKCPECGTTIGGTNHRPAAGNARKERMDERTQAGYVLNKYTRNKGEAEDRVSKQGAAVMQFLLHACMLCGMQNDEATILQMLTCNKREEAFDHLTLQLNMNITALSQSLARNVDDTVLILHKILLRILNQRAGAPVPDWSTMEKRRLWEEKFREQYLLPVFRNLDNEIMTAQNVMNEAEDLSSLSLYKLVHGISMRHEPTVTEIAWDDPMLWYGIQHSNSAHLLQVLGDSAEAQKGEVLQIILQMPDLHHVKFLELVLQLQNALIQKYQNEIDINDSERITMKDFLKDGGHSYEKHVREYIKIWNMVLPKLQAKLSGDIKVNDYFEPMDTGSPISMGLPSTRGRGQCAKLLSEHLIEVQNAYLTECKQVLKSSQSINEVEVGQLSHSHFVCIDKQRDLLPLIHMHTKYNVTINEQGRHHNITYNIDALEKQVREKFAMYKKLILKQTLPCMQYPQDIGIGSDWDKVLEKVNQKPLTAKLAQDVDRIVARVPSADVCEGVRTLTHAISFLAKVKCSGKTYLYEFLEKDLLLSTSRISVIPKSAQIEHTLSLYLRLSWHKSVNFAQRGLNPYKDALSTVEQVDITERYILKKLSDVFEHSDVTLLQQRLNEILIKIPDLNSEWSLTEIFPYFDFIDESNDEDDSWYSRLPKEICFKHISHLFSLAVQFTSRHRIL